MLLVVIDDRRGGEPECTATHFDLRGQWLREMLDDTALMCRVLVENIDIGANQCVGLEFWQLRFQILFGFLEHFLQCAVSVNDVES